MLHATRLTFLTLVIWFGAQALAALVTDPATPLDRARIIHEFEAVSAERHALDGRLPLPGDLPDDDFVTDDLLDELTERYDRSAGRWAEVSREPDEPAGSR